MSSKHIVKIQRPIVCSGEPEYLIYNESRSVLVQFAMAAMPELADLMGDNYKVYAKATLQDDGILVIDELVEEQDW